MIPDTMNVTKRAIATVTEIFTALSKRFDFMVIAAREMPEDDKILDFSFGRI
jgi:hypothetical protein